MITAKDVAEGMIAEVPDRHFLKVARPVAQPLNYWRSFARADFDCARDLGPRTRWGS